HRCRTGTARAPSISHPRPRNSTARRTGLVSACGWTRHGSRTRPTRCCAATAASNCRSRACNRRERIWCRRGTRRPTCPWESSRQLLQPGSPMRSGLPPSSRDVSRVPPVPATDTASIQRRPGCGRGGSAGGRGGFGYGGGFGFVVIPLHPRCTVQSSPRSYSAAFDGQGVRFVRGVAPISARRQRIIGCYCTLEVVGFRAGDQADLFQGRKLLFGFGGVPEHQIELTEVLVRTAVTAIEHDGLLIILHRRPELAKPTIGIADVVVD